MRGLKARAQTASRLSGRAVVLTSASPLDENTFEQPNKVVPRASPISNLAPSFERLFPPHSVTMLRLK